MERHLQPLTRIMKLQNSNTRSSHFLHACRTPDFPIQDFSSQNVKEQELTPFFSGGDVSVTLKNTVTPGTRRKTDRNGSKPPIEEPYLAQVDKIEWEVTGVTADPQSGTGETANFKVTTLAEGKLTYTVTLKGIDGVDPAWYADFTKDVPLVLLPVQIEEISFGGTKYWELKSDDAATTYSAPHWKDVDGNGKPINTTQGERDYAVAFTRNTKPKIGAKFKIASASNFGAIKIKATGPGGVTIPETAATVSGDEVTLPLTEASTVLVNTIKFYDKKDDAKAFKLEWELKIGSSDWSKISTTKHTVYVTLDDPSPMKDFNGNNVTLRQETLFEIGCRNADGESSQASATAKIWSEFTDRVVKRMDGTQMTYYGSYLCTDTDAASLLQFGDGQCGAWADLLIRTRQVQGMNDPNEYRFFFSKKGLSVEGFAVKDWTFHGAGTSGDPAYPYLNILPIGNPDSYIGQNSYNFAYAEVTDDNGVAGQGNPNPASLFNNHQVMVSGEYYDPSYGVKRASLADIDDGAISGFYKVDQVLLNEAVYNLDFNQDGDKVDTAVPAFVFLFRKNPAGNDLNEQSQDR